MTGTMTLIMDFGLLKLPGPMGPAVRPLVAIISALELVFWGPETGPFGAWGLGPKTIVSIVLPSACYCMIVHD